MAYSLRLQYLMQVTMLPVEGGNSIFSGKTFMGFI